MGHEASFQTANSHLVQRYEDLKIGGTKNCAVQHSSNSLIRSAKQNTPPVQAGV